MKSVHFVKGEKGTFFFTWAQNEHLLMFTLRAFLNLSTVYSTLPLSISQRRSCLSTEAFHDLTRLTGQNKWQRVGEARRC